MTRPPSALNPPVFGTIALLLKFREERTYSTGYFVRSDPLGNAVIVMLL